MSACGDHRHGRHFLPWSELEQAVSKEDVAGGALASKETWEDIEVASAIALIDRPVIAALNGMRWDKGLN